MTAPWRPLPSREPASPRLLRRASGAWHEMGHRRASDLAAVSAVALLCVASVLLVAHGLFTRGLDRAAEAAASAGSLCPEVSQRPGSGLADEWPGPGAYEGRARSLRSVVIGWPRTGSNLLVTSLAAHPEVVFHGEIFHEDQAFVDPDVQEALPSAPTLASRPAQHCRRAHPEPFLEEIWDRTEGATAVGFKLFPGHIVDSQVSTLLLQDTRVAKVVVYRRDMLELCTSLALAMRSANWDSMMGGYEVAGKSAGPIRLSIGAYQDCTAAYMGWFRYVTRQMRQVGETWTEVSYEELAESYPATMRRLFEYLGANASFVVDPPIQKQRKGPLASVLENHDELLAEMARRNATRYYRIE